MMIKKLCLVLATVSTLFFSACGVSKSSIETLGKCKYDVTSLDSIYIANSPINALLDGGVGVSNMPSIALGLLRKNIPLEAKVNLKIDNPTLKRAALNKFQYVILLQNKQLIEGFVNQSISLEPGESQVLPIKLSMNIYDLVTGNDSKTFRDAIASLKNEKGNKSNSILTLKIKPAMNIAGKQIFYPGYITIDKEVSKKILF